MNAYDELVTDVCSQIRLAEVVELEDIPTIDLYMDQVTTFMDHALTPYKRCATDKALTKTMINNYTKAKIFPPPVKKKYSKTHLMLLIMIYHLKSILSIRDIGVVFRFALEESDKEKQNKMIETIYIGFVRLQKATQEYLSASAQGIPDNTFFEKTIIAEYQQDEMKRILLVLLLVIRANAEKQLAERALDFYF